MKAAKSVTLSKNLYRTFQKSVVRKQHNIVMGIETSFDDTGCAIMDSSGNILGESTNSQTKIHTEMGGVMPTLAKELHEENISNVVNQTLKNANMTVNDIDAVAVTTKPGLKGSLYVGTNYGIKLCRDFNKPFIPVHHMQAHALTARITHKVEFPFLVLLISGAHCILSVAETPVNFQLLGSSINDAPGEAMDKIARRMKLRLLPEFRNCCGGEALEKSAAKGYPEAIPLTVPLLQKRDCNFSFSGIKTAASIHIQKQEEKYSIVGSSLIPDVHNLSASVLHTITKHLVQRVQRGMLFVSMKNIIPPEKQTLVVSGGVACNNYIKRGLEILTNDTGYKLIVPPPKFCTDNGVMIAWNGIEKLRLQHDVIPPTELDSIEVEAKSPIGEDLTEAVAAASIKVKTIKLHSLYRKNSDEENIKKAVSK